MIVKKSRRRVVSIDGALYDVISFIRPLYRACAKAVEDRLAGTGVTVGMRAVMEQLDENGSQTAPQIGRSMGIQRQYVQCMVNAGRELELLYTVANPAHKRSVLVELTPKGRKLFRRIRAREQDVLRRIAKQVSRREVDACIHVLRTLTEEFEKIAWEEEDA